MNFEEVKVEQQVAFMKNRKVAEAIHSRTKRPALTETRAMNSKDSMTRS